MLPATEVGGDYFDILPTDEGCFVGVGDVAGHGLTAGLVMLMTQSVVSALVQANPGASPREVVLDLNRVLHENIRQRLGNREHLTFTLLKVFDDGRVQHAGAHEEIMVRRAGSGQVESYPTRGAWLGAVPDLSGAVFQQELRLVPGDVLLLHTDGITEARNDAREEYGPERLAAALGRSEASAADQLCFQLMRQVESFSPDRADDRSVVVVRYLGQQESGQLDRDVVGGEARERV
jgi:serine phosphatase RsbU (regulator of sigma subunit)